MITEDFASSLSDEHSSIEDLRDDNVIVSTADWKITSPAAFKYNLRQMFTDKTFADKLFVQIMAGGANFDTMTVSELIIELKKIFRNSINWDEHFTQATLNNLNDIIAFEQNIIKTASAYTKEGKPRPDGIWWPIPTHEKYPRTKYDTQPYVKKFPILNRQTPVGSAGSCFASEIAKYLQQRNYNYVVTEFADKPESEALVEGYEVGSGKALFSANFGILFNTPSLRQLAEKAFGLRQFTQHLLLAEEGFYVDPYRENVCFKSKQAYLRDYPKHITAIKRVLLESEVFIFTAGLNECWELRDGTVISRNPRPGFHHFLQHKTLSVQENIDNIVEFYRQVKQRNPKFKLILTLSPVPFLATARANTHHVVEANTHSKAVLRVALDEVVQRYEDIYYLPSYEIVTECIEQPWQADHRHVTEETVMKVMDLFEEMFVKNDC